MLADLLPVVAITAATITLFDVEMNSFVRIFFKPNQIF